MKFEKYLQEIHAKQYVGLDDDMPDDYQDWLCNLDIEYLIDYADIYAQKYALQAISEMTLELLNKLKEAK